MAEIRVALTFDDLPSLVLDAPSATCEVMDPGERRCVAQRLVETLRSASVPAVAFVNSGFLGGQEDLVRPWIEAGVELGNHTARHSSVDSLPLDVWADEVRECDAFLGAMGSTGRRFFRHPYLRYGGSPHRQAAARRFLLEEGYVQAHATAVPADWLLARFYREARDCGDTTRMRRVEERLAGHTLEVLEAAHHSLRRLLGRPAPQVLDLHVHRLAAAHLDSTLDRLRKGGACFIPLTEALADPVYQLDPTEWSAGGSWVERLAPASADALWFRRQPDRLRRWWREQCELPSQSSG
ncbi:MAG: polysaccharide deacetylase family protein [Acidobacteria bacterium]|nr:polysaccharide deacetylase family protein [Acidobacteriota bacterium]